MSSARRIAESLRDIRTPNGSDARVIDGAAIAIDTLLDVIEAQRGPAVVSPDLDLEPLRELRLWHQTRRDVCQTTSVRDWILHSEAVRILNRYFLKDNQL